MSIAVSVQNWKFPARNNSGSVRQESVPQSPTLHLLIARQQCEEANHNI
jgi:hypothetical protein